ncbi:ABC transporter permease [Bacillus sp. FJAT-45066]|uniref:ABC transporter permease n=1 Tax=Bacillus sp. FJAT-45066 TaxID=2011010 RepID=UPI000BB7E1BA|nr:iron export ABC transporter permease subunit FetB [Bacillus sp. FJAT-45066]
MNPLALLIALVFVFIPIFLSKTYRLGLEKDTTIAVVRSIIQLFIVGYLLTFVFEAESYVFIIIIIVIMIAAAVQNVTKKETPIKGIVWKVTATLLFIQVLTQGILLGFGIIPATAQYIIPISGMVIGNSMVLGILFLDRFISEVESREDEIELILSLGGNPKQAIHSQLILSIKASMIPTIESQKTIGLVQLPGMMSGQIIAGASPIQAVQFQLLILFLLLTTASVTSVMLGLLSYPTLFNNRKQLMKIRE